jgi:hypothetical protein
MKVGDKVIVRGVQGVLVHIDENPNTGLPYLTVTYKDGRSRAEWVSENELIISPKFKVGDVVKNGNGLEHVIISVSPDEKDSEYTVFALMHRNTSMAGTNWFSKDGYLRVCDPESKRNLIPN